MTSAQSGETIFTGGRNSLETASSHLSVRATPWREREKVKSLSVLDLKLLRVPSVPKVKIDKANVLLEEEPAEAEKTGNEPVVESKVLESGVEAEED